MGAEVRVLGPVEVLGPQGQAELAGTRQRGLLALLALGAGRPLSQWRLVDALWGETPPRTAIRTLHSHVARVRQALADCGLPGRLITQGQAYALTLPRDTVDAHSFEDQVTLARRHLAAGDPTAATTALRHGLRLWRGEALTDAAPQGWAIAEVNRLHEVKLTATEDLWEAELARGRHLAAVNELNRLLVEEPNRERLVELYMLALYRSGRQTEALDAYQRLRTRLADELGIDPGPALQQRHTAILRRDPALERGGPQAPASISIPAQLPATVGHFTGRDTPLAQLDELMSNPDDETRIAVVSGQAGIGKTAFAVHWAHQVAARFGAGQLVIDLRGHEPDTAIPPTEALGHLLRGLGVPASRIPAGLDELTNLYRSLTSGKPILIVADNAASADQVLPLVPATDTGFLLVTSRQRLTALATHHAVAYIGLDALSDHEAVALLSRVAGAGRIAREPAAVARIAQLCDGLPLALRIAAAKLAADPDRPITRMVADLTSGDRLDELTVAGDSRSVRTVFASAYRALPAQQARLFRLLATHPGPTFDAHLAAAIAGLDPATAKTALARLTTAHLVIGGEGRYRFHDLIRLYAAECARRDDTPAGLEQARERMLDWYLGVADAANRIIGRARDRVAPKLRHPPVSLPFHPEHEEILAFLDGERANMTPIVRYATDHGCDTAAWQLTYLLTGFFEYRGYWTERVELCRLGLAAAERQGDLFAASLMYSTLGVACVELHRFPEALDHLRQAFLRMESVGDKRGQGVALNNMAVAYLGMRQYSQAVEAGRQALVIHRANNHTVGVALALNNVGYSYAELGQTELALPHLTEALQISRGLQNSRLEAGVLNSLGQAHLYSGDNRRALNWFAESLAVRTSIGDRRNTAETLNLIGLSHLRLDEPLIALDYLRDAEAISHDAGDLHLEAVIRNHIGAARLHAGELDAADEQLRQALDLRKRVPDRHEEAAIHTNLADLADRRGDATAARLHRDHAAALCQSAGITPGPDQSVSRSVSMRRR